MTRVRGRIPVICLDYSEKHKAVEKEIMVDYETGNIYIVSATDKSVIFDITSKIKEQLDNISGSKIEVNIEGIGTVVLNDLLNQMKTDLNNSVQIIESEDSDINYVSKESVLDNRTIETNKNLIQVKGFSQARELALPRKRNGQIEWVTIDDLVLNGEGGIIGGGGENGSGSGSTIAPGNPDDGGILSCIIQQPTNGKIFLKSSKRQKSKNIAEDCIVYMPKILDEYAEVLWYVVTNSFAPELRFFGNMVWKNNTRQLSKNSHHLLRFFTWDFGDTWLAEINTYDAEIREDGAIDKAYLDANYYTMRDSDARFVNKNHLAESYLDRDQIARSYYDTDEMQEKYYDKQSINTFLEFKDKK